MEGSDMNNYVDTVIQLPPDLFIDASAEFVRSGNKTS